MSYAVHHVDGEGATHLEDHASLDDALARVEALRNDGRAAKVRVFKEIPIEVRTYYRVVAVEDGPEAPVDTAVQAEVPEVPEPVGPPPEPEDAADPREQPVRLQPPPGAMLIGPAPTSPEPAPAPEAREHATHRGIFSRG